MRCFPMAVPPPPPPSDDQPAPTEPGVPRSGVMMICAAACLVLAASMISGQDTSADASRAQSAAAAPQQAASVPHSAASAAQPVGKHLPRSRPVRLRIPKIWVDAPFTGLSLGPNGQLQPPPGDDPDLG